MLEKLTENWILKLLSLTFALILWFFVMGEQKVEVGYSVPLEISSLPEGMMVANEVPSRVDVRISGPRTLLVNLKESDISIAVDLKGLQPGTTTFRRLEERLNIPTGLKVTRLSPSFVDIKLERVRDKKVSVRAILNGIPAEGFRVGTITTNPSRVLISGAESELKDVSEVTTEPVDIEGARESFTLMAPLIYDGRYSSLQEHQAVEVTLTIEQLPLVAPEKTTKKAKKP